MIKIKHLTESLNKKYLLKEEINPNFDYNEFLKLAEFLKMKTSVKALITALYPDDDLCQEIDDDITFGDVKKALENGTDIYDVIGVDDSVIREYVFKTLADILNVSYDDVYALWLYDDKNEKLDEEYSLVGQNGNAFALMGYTARCMKECGLRDEVDEMRERAMSGDYYNLIAVCDEYIQRCNEINPDLEESLGYDYVNAKSLKESRWEHTLKNGERLRHAIHVCIDHDEPDNEDYADVLKAIYACYKELRDREIIDDDDFGRYTDDFDMYLYDNFQDWDDPEEIINYELNDLYDLCDNLDVWVSLGESLNESADSVWVIIPTENRYDDNLDIMKFARKYGVYNSKKEVYDKIDELAPDRYDAFIPYKIMTESLNEDVQKELFDKPGEFWYFTKHGIGPGAVPKVNIEKIVEKDGGEYFLIKDKILSTYALDKYDIKEKSPNDIDEDWKSPKGEFAGWVAIYNGKKIEIAKDEANSLYDAKLKAIEKLNVPKSKQGLLVIEPGYNESLNEAKEHNDYMNNFLNAVGDYINTRIPGMSSDVSGNVLHIQANGDEVNVGMKVDFVPVFTVGINNEPVYMYTTEKSITHRDNDGAIADVITAVRNELK